MGNNNCVDDDKVFYGSTTIGEKGQLVIPAEARKALGLEKGEKLLVFGVHGNMLALAPMSELESLVEKMAKQTQDIQSIIQSEK